MKKLTLIGSCMVATMAQAGNPPFSITQSDDLATITDTNSVACPADNDSYMRRFNLDEDHGLNATLEINQVDFAVESTTSLTLTVTLHSINNSAELLLANLTPIGTADLAVSDLDNLMPVSIDISGTVDGSLNDLVVQVFAPDSTNGTNFFIGSNANGQTAPSYLLSDVCGATEPTATGDLGFGNMQVIMSVDGTITGVGDLIYKDGFDINLP